MKKLILFSGILALVTAYGQDHVRYQLETGFNFNSVRPHLRSGYWDYDAHYVAKSKGGDSYNFFAVNSLRLGKWFVDLELNLNHVKIYQNIILPAEEPDPVSIDFEHRLNFFMPAFSGGRFIRINDHFRISLAVGLDFAFLLTRKEMTGSRVRYNFYPTFTSTVEDIYNYRFSYFSNPGGGHAVLGFYMPIGNNELAVKCRAMTTGYTGAYATLRKVENYEYVTLFEDPVHLFQSMIGFSVAYRFNQFKTRKE